MNYIMDMDINYDRFISILQEKISYLTPYSDISSWKKLYIFEISENIIFLNNNDIIPIDQRSLDFNYIIYPEITYGSLAFTKGIVTIIYNHFNDLSLLINIIINKMIKQGINQNDIINVSNNIFFKNKKISGYSSETKNGYTSEIVFLIINYEEELISKGFNNSDDLNEYSGIKNLYPNFNELVFYSNIQHEISEENISYLETNNNNIISLIDTNNVIDENYERSPIILSETLSENLSRLLEIRKIIDSGGVVDNFKEFNDLVCLELYKEYRPILENYDELTKESLYKNRFKMVIKYLKLGEEEPLFGNELRKFPIDILWNFK